MEEKQNIFSTIEKKLQSQNLSIVSVDNNRPWGGFFVIDEKDAPKFIEYYFPTIEIPDLLKGKISPKILLIAPHKKISWQYHHRRAELWTLIGGTASVILSDTDEEKNPLIMQAQECVSIGKGIRHRLVGQDQWGIVAEIWVHTNEHLPSNEEDIVRVQDDFGRN